MFHRLFDHMRACLQETTLSSSSTAVIQDDKYDHRYFYYTDDGIGHCLTGDILDIVLSMLHKHAPSFLDGESWILAVKKASNPYRRMTLLTRLCISRIASLGLQRIDSRLKPMPFMYFDKMPSWIDAILIKESIVRYLFIPGQDCDALVDGIIFYLDRKNKVAELLPVQIASTTETLCADKSFYSSNWKELIRSLSARKEMSSLKIQSTFLFLRYEKVSEKPSTVQRKASGDGWELEYNYCDAGLSVLDDGFENIGGR